MRWPFAKYVGSGNDFILFDNRQGVFPLTQSHLIQRLCHRQRGIGADGILLLELSIHADCRMRLLNRDGSEAEMCGNGLRCFIKWLSSLGFQRQMYHVEIMHRILKASQIGEEICIEMGQPHHIQWNIPLHFENQFLNVHHLNTGVPHTLLFMDQIDQINLSELGPYIRYHTLWQPQGTNVTLVQKIDSRQLKVRTYERGVEAETLACGTGATAAALAAAYHFHLTSPLVIQTRSGEELRIDFSLHPEYFSDVKLTGPAQCTFVGEIDF